VVVYPGIEITCLDDAQCLAIFDPSCDSPILHKLLEKISWRDASRCSSR